MTYYPLSSCLVKPKIARRSQANPGLFVPIAFDTRLDSAASIEYFYTI